MVDWNPVLPKPARLKAGDEVMVFEDAVGENNPIGIVQLLFPVRMRRKKEGLEQWQVKFITPKGRENTPIVMRSDTAANVW